MRSAFDKLISWTGLAIAVVLLVAGGLLTWASTFVGDQVASQFGQQDITMPTEEGIAGQVASGSLSDADADALSPFAGQPLDSGPAAHAYADHYILAHMNAGTGELAATLQELGVQDPTSLEGWKDPLTYQAAGAVASSLEDTPEAAAAVNEFRSETLFKGNTLRGLLLYGYAFATIGQIAGIAAIAAFAGAVVLLILAVLGLRHASRAKDADPAATA